MRTAADQLNTIAEIENSPEIGPLDDDLADDELLIEEISIDGMCGVY